MPLVKFYAGIGSRTITSAVHRELLSSVAALLEEKGYILRSGGAVGADNAFESGVFQPPMKEIYRPEISTPEADLIAATIHPNWMRCTGEAVKCHGRNVMIILGRQLTTPVDFTLFASKDETKGSTRTGIVLSRNKTIPNFNLITKAGFEAWVKFYAERIAV